jgi:heme exporter protein B
MSANTQPAVSVLKATTQQSAATPAASWHIQAVALYRKDIRAETRTRVAINSVGLFAFSSLFLLALATRGLREVQSIKLLNLPLSNISMGDVTKAQTPAWTDASKLGMLWVLLVFSAFAGLAHGFVHEEEAGTSTALRLTMNPQAVYAGKLGFNLTLLSLIAVLVTPLYMSITGMSSGSLGNFAIVMAAGCIGLGSTATIVAVLASKARGSGALFGAIGLPMIVVFLMLLLNAANTLYNAEATRVRMVQDFGGLLSFGILLITVSALTFKYVWEE